jgi:hypothetical protein
MHRVTAKGIGSRHLNHLAVLLAQNKQVFDRAEAATFMKIFSV